MLRVSVFLLSAIGLAGGALAQNNWSVPGSVCVPAGASIRAGNFDTVQGSVTFATGEVGEIVLNCPILRFNSGTTEYNLKMRYRDSTGTAVSGSVRATLLQTPIGTAVTTTLGSVTSDSSAVTTQNTLASPAIAHAFDFETNIYWVRVVLKRTAPAQIVVFQNTYLDGTAF